MRVVIDGGAWTNRRGFGRMTRELVKALGAHGRHDYALVVDATADVEALPPRVAVVPVRLDVPPAQAASADGWRSGSDLVRMSRALSAERGDLVFFPCVYTYVPLWTRHPIVTGVHDTIAERFPELVFPEWRARWFWRMKMQLALRQSARIVAVSAHARDSVHTHLGVPLDRISTINEAAADTFRPIEDREAIARSLRALGVDPDDRVIVYVGGLAPHKNLVRILRAFTQVARRRPFDDARLLLIGDHLRDVFHSHEGELRLLARRAGPGRIVLASSVPDEQLALVLNGARALILASLDEGFGLPAVEAAACGTPVIATRFSAMPEVLGDAALYVDPLDECSIGAALEVALEDGGLRERLGKPALARARAMTWRRAAEALDAICDEVAGRGSAA